MQNDNNLLVFRPEFIIAGTMYVTNQKEVTYKQIQKFNKALADKASSNGDRCLILFSNVYLQEVEHKYYDLFYIGEKFIALNKKYNLEILDDKIFANQPANTFKYLFSIKDEKNKKTNANS